MRFWARQGIRRARRVDPEPRRLLPESRQSVSSCASTVPRAAFGKSPLARSGIVRLGSLVLAPEDAIRQGALAMTGRNLPNTPWDGTDLPRAIATDDGMVRHASFKELKP